MEVTFSQTVYIPGGMFLIEIKNFIPNTNDFLIREFLKSEKIAFQIKSEKWQLSKLKNTLVAPYSNEHFCQWNMECNAKDSNLSVNIGQERYAKSYSKVCKNLPMEWHKFQK